MLHCQCQLGLEGVLLVGTRGKVSIEVQPHLAGGFYALLSQ